MLNVLIERDWLDHDFIREHTTGFEAAAAAVHDHTPKWAEQVTGVPAARIGRTGGDRIGIEIEGSRVIDCALAEAETRWRTSLSDWMEGRAA